MTRRATHLLRHALLAGVAAFLPGIAASQPLASGQSERQLFAPPAGPFILTRTLERAFPDGARIVSRRSYKVRFVAEPGGFRVEGELLSAEVEAPESLGFLAELERTRPDTGLFPMRLDAGGSLLEQGARTGPDGNVREAAGHVARTLAGLSLPRVEARDAAAFVEQLRRNGMHTQWPADLFRPIPGRRSQTVPVPLPGGATGSVRIDLDAQVRSGGLLSLFRRRVVTELGDSQRRTDETWALETSG